jgi:hypothetical protein
MNYGIHVAGEIIRQGGALIAAAKKPENAAALAKLAAEGLNEDELAKGERLYKDAEGALAFRKAGTASSAAASDSKSDAGAQLHDAYIGRLKKTRAKLKEHDENKPLLAALNTAIRGAGDSHGALFARVTAFLEVIAEPMQRSSSEAKVTIAQVAGITDDQIQVVRAKLEAFKAGLSELETSAGSTQSLAREKDAAVRRLDRWLAKWQDIAKCDFTEAELTAFGIPVNVSKSRRRQTRPVTEPKPVVA